MTESEQIEKLLREYYSQQGMLKGYIYSVIRDYHATDDILQEIAIVVAQKAATFDFDRPTRPWFMGIAKKQIQRWFRAKGKRQVHVSFDLLEDFICENENFTTDAMTSRETALKKCVSKLPAKQKNILNLRYADGMNCEEIAGVVHRSVQGIYAVLKRLKGSLRTCVEFQLERGA